MSSGDDGKDASEEAILNVKFVTERGMRKTRVSLGLGVETELGTGIGPEWARMTGLGMLLLFVVPHAWFAFSLSVSK